MVWGWMGVKRGGGRWRGRHGDRPVRQGRCGELREGEAGTSQAGRLRSQGTRLEAASPERGKTFLRAEPA